MDNVQNKDDQDPNIENLDEAAIQAEEEGLKSKSKDEIRNQIITDYELDEDDNSELIDKLVADKLVDQKRLSTAIKQKRGWRTKAQSIPPKEDPVKVIDKPGESSKDVLFNTKDIDAQVDAKLLKRDIDALDVSDELRSEVKNYVKLHGVTVKDAMKSSYISYLKEQEDKKAKAEEAGLDGTKRRSQSKQDFTDMGPKDFDLSTDEGRKGWDEYKKWLKSQ